MPLTMMRCGALPAISAPSNSIEPAVGTSVPESMLKIVLLPEPFGPIRPRISPSSTWNETFATAVKPPKRLTSPLTSSTRARSLRRVRRGGRQFQHRLPLLLRLRPNDGDRIDVEKVVGVAADALLQLRIDAVAGAVPDQCREAQPELARLAQEQRDVRVVAGVEDHVRLAALQLGDERRQVGGGGRIALVE